MWPSATCRWAHALCDVYACSSKSPRMLRSKLPPGQGSTIQGMVQPRPFKQVVTSGSSASALLSKMSGCRCAKTTLAHAILFLLEGLSSLATRQHPQDTPCSLCEAIPTCAMARTWFVQTASLSFHSQALVEPRDFPPALEIGQFRSRTAWHGPYPRNRMLYPMGRWRPACLHCVLRRFARRFGSRLVLLVCLERWGLRLCATSTQRRQILVGHSKFLKHTKAIEPASASAGLVGMVLRPGQDIDCGTRGSSRQTKCLAQSKTVRAVVGPRRGHREIRPCSMQGHLG